MLKQNTNSLFGTTKQQTNIKIDNDNEIILPSFLYTFHSLTLNFLLAWSIGSRWNTQKIKRATINIQKKLRNGAGHKYIDPIKTRKLIIETIRHLNWLLA